MTEKDRGSDYSDHHQRDKFAHMKAAQRNRNERGQLAVKIVCGAIASFLAGAFVASELFALSTRFSRSLGEHYFYLYPPWAIIDWWFKWHATSPAMFTQSLQLGGALAAAILIAYSIHVVTRAQALRQYSDIHGSARWAKLSDIKKLACCKPKEFTSANGRMAPKFTRSVTMGRSMSFVTPHPAPVNVLAWFCPPC